MQSVDVTESADCGISEGMMFRVQSFKTKGVSVSSECALRWCVYAKMMRVLCLVQTPLRCTFMRV